jgi:predicted XRE-type DNA-binding protein
MKIDVAIEHVTPADGNIFLDLGFSEVEAAALKAELDQEIAQRQAIKEELRSEVTGWIKAKRLKQDEAAEILHITRPRVSDIVNGKLSKFSIDSLVAMVIRTGKQVKIVTS